MIRQLRSLHLTTDTVQDHLKSVFDRTGVHSRGELVATILQRDYLPHAIAGDPITRSGHSPSNNRWRRELRTVPGQTTAEASSATSGTRQWITSASVHKGA